jgi:predicted Rdx family selenoprotein
VGNRGEYTIWVDDTKVIEKQDGRFPDPKEVVAVVRSRQP